MTVQAPPLSGSDHEWTLAELKTARLALNDEIALLRQVLTTITMDLASQAVSFIRHGGEVSDMEARLSELDAKTLLVANSIDVLAQCERAVEQIAHLRYGTCEACERPVGKARLLAIPRATLCLQCQQTDR